MSKRVYTTERTSKSIKAFQAVGVVTLLLGLLMLGNGSATASAVIFAGVVCTVAAKVAAWWFHG